MMTKVDCIANHRCSLGESPVWSEAAQALYWLDIAASSTLFEWSRQNSAVRRWPLHELASGLALSESGDLVVVAQTGISFFDIGRGKLRRIAEVPFSMQCIRFNDCGCDRAGRLWTGTMLNNFAQKMGTGDAEPQNDAMGGIYRFDPDLSCHVMAQGFGCPNTFAWSPDDTTLYTADSAAQCIYAYRFDLAAGEITDRRIFANPNELGVPDGSAMDSQGYLWNARWGAGCVVRFAPDGSVDKVVQIPAKLVTSCTFGGEALSTLFVTTASCDLSEQELAREPLAGAVFAFEPEVPGVPTARFRGSGEVA